MFNDPFNSVFGCIRATKIIQFSLGKSDIDPLFLFFLEKR